MRRRADDAASRSWPRARRCLIVSAGIEAATRGRFCRNSRSMIAQAVRVDEKKSEDQNRTARRPSASSTAPITVPPLAVRAGAPLNASLSERCAGRVLWIRKYASWRTYRKNRPQLSRLIEDRRTIMKPIPVSVPRMAR